MKNQLRIAIFGAGYNGERFIEKCHNSKIVIIFDNDSTKWSKKIMQVEILPPSKLLDFEFDYLVITSAYEEIKNEIILLYPCLEDKICSVNKFWELEFVYVQYKKNIDFGKKYKYDFTNKKIVIYTGIFGDYDLLKEPLVIEDNIDYICFTDNKNLKSKYWKIQYVNCEESNKAVEVRKYKCLPHLFLEKYDISVWMDASGQISNSIKEFIEQYMRQSGLLLFPHYQRDCIYEEGAVNIIQRREKTSKIVNQMYTYYRESYPEHHGLYCGGYIVREHNRKEIIKCMEDWYKEVIDKSARDQISLPYVLWKNNISPDLCNEHVFYNRWFKHFAHMKSD